MALVAKRVRAGQGVMSLALLVLWPWAYCYGTTAAPADLLDMTLEQLLNTTVTGSRLQHEKLRSSAAVLSFSRDDIEASGADNIGELLARLPINGSTLNVNGSSGTAHGTASVNLRNLGENRVLVLLNGRRLMNGTATRGFRDFVDLNTVPLALIDHIEILEDSAAAIYGADAIAGVVNLITRDKFTGVQLHLRGGRSGHNDSGQSGLDALIGEQWGPWQIWGGFSALKNDAAYVDDRDFSAQPLGSLSGVTENGHFTIPGRGDLTLIDGRSGQSIDDFRAFDAQHDQFNPFAGTYLRYPWQQQALFGRAGYEREATHWYAEWLMTRRQSEQNFSAAPLRLNGSDGYHIPAEHPFNPFGMDLGGSGFIVQRTFDVMGRRVNQQRVNTARLATGLEGELSEAWRWRVDTQWGVNHGEFRSNNQLDRDHFALSLGSSEACAAISTCVQVNVFGDNSSFSPAAINWLSVDGLDHNETKQRILSAGVLGSLAHLPAGDWQLASGMEWRRETATDTPDDYFSKNATLVSGAATTSAQREGTHGSYHVAEAYAEMQLPLLGNEKASTLESVLALRRSQYDAVGGKTTFRAGVVWLPFSHWQWRLNWSQGFRAPSLLELYEGERNTNLPAIDPCSADSSLPGCAGVPDSYQQNGSRVNALVGGNAQLQPETSSQWDLGSSWQWNESWNIGVDAYRIVINDIILAFSSQQILDDCAYFRRRCDLIARNPVTGEINQLHVQQGNAGQREIKGMDLDLHAQFDNGFSSSAQIAYLNQFRDTQSIANVVTSNELQGKQFLRASYPKWRALLAQDYRWQQWQLNYQVRYIHSMQEDSVQPDIAARWYHDIMLRYHYSIHTLTLGVTNLLDRDPPTSLVNANINFDIGSYDSRGRFVYASGQFDWR